MSDDDLDVPRRCGICSTRIDTDDFLCYACMEGYHKRNRPFTVTANDDIDDDYASAPHPSAYYESTDD